MTTRRARRSRTSAHDGADRAADHSSHGRASDRASDRTDRSVVGIGRDRRSNARRGDDRQNNRLHVRPPSFLELETPRPWPTERSLAAKVPPPRAVSWPGQPRSSRRVAIPHAAKGTTAGKTRFERSWRRIGQWPIRNRWTVKQKLATAVGNAADSAAKVADSASKLADKAQTDGAALSRESETEPPIFPGRCPTR